MSICLHLSISNIHYVDMSDGVDDADALTDLYRAINRRAKLVSRRTPRPLWEPATPKPGKIVEKPRPDNAPPVKTPTLQLPQAELNRVSASNKTLDEPSAIVRAAWIGVLGVVLAAIIGGLFLVFLNNGGDDSSTTGTTEQIDTPTRSSEEDVTAIAEAQIELTDLAETETPTQTTVPTQTERPMIPTPTDIPPPELAAADATITAIFQEFEAATETEAAFLAPTLTRQVTETMIAQAMATQQAVETEVVERMATVVTWTPTPTNTLPPSNTPTLTNTPTPSNTPSSLPMPMPPTFTPPPSATPMLPPDAAAPRFTEPGVLCMGDARDIYYLQPAPVFTDPNGPAVSPGDRVQYEGAYQYEESMSRWWYQVTFNDETGWLEGEHFVALALCPVSEQPSDDQSIQIPPSDNSQSLAEIITLARNFSGSNADWTPVERDFELPQGGTVTMVLVPAGCFEMGSNDGADDEQPIHEICFDEPFWIDKYEVTNNQYGSLGCSDWSSDPDQPRNCVDWFEASDHCDAREARLPTEAEWEYAARGPDALVYPWGNEYDTALVIGEDDPTYGNTRTASVDSRPSGASWVGALDLSGNVWEWTSSRYRGYPYGNDHEDINPSWSRVLRGGSFVNSRYLLRSATRFRYNPAIDLRYIGFRCARSID